MNKATTLAAVSRLILACACAFLLLAGCGSASTRPQAISDLRGPGISTIPEFESFLSNYPTGLLIRSLGSYTVDEQSSGFLTTTPTMLQTTQTSSTLFSRRIIVVFSHGDGSRYYDIGLDGSNPHPLSLRIPCFQDLAITPNGQWGACVTQKGVAAFRILPTLPSTPQLEERLLLLNDSQYGYGSLSWDPTGRYLSVARVSGWSQPAPLDVFAISSGYDQARLILRLSSPFAFSSAQWSSDSRWFFVETRDTATAASAEYYFSLSQVEPSLPLYTGTPLYTTILRTQFHASMHTMIWRPGSPAQWTWISEDGILYQQATPDGTAERLGDLGFPPVGKRVGAIFAAVWTADGKQLIIALCDPASGDIGGLPPKIFVYTPPSD